MKRILIAVGDYYPVSSANGICVKILAEELKKRGYEVHCVANGYNNDRTIKQVDGVTVHFVKTPLLWKLLDFAKNDNRYPLKKILMIIWRFLIYLRIPLYLISFPAESRMHRNRFSHAVANIIKENSIAAVIGVNKPIEAIWGSYLAAKDNDIPMISYFLDPLAGGIENHLVGKQQSYKRSADVEKEILNYCKHEHRPKKQLYMLPRRLVNP